MGVLVSLDFHINLSLREKRAQARIKNIIFEVIERSSAQERISPLMEETLDQMWQYLNMKTVKKVANAAETGSKKIAKAGEAHGGC